MKRIFEEYGGVVVTVIAVVCLIALVTFLMSSNGPVSKAFTNLVQSFVDASDGLLDSAASSNGSSEGESGGTEGEGGTGNESGDAGEEALAAGLYDADGNLLADWDELVNVYGMDVTAPGAGDILYNEELSAGTKLVIGDGVTEIGEEAFVFSMLTSIVLPDGVTTIGYYAFSDSAIFEATIPASVTSIGGDAFGWCVRLTTVTFAANSQLESIGSSAFCGCRNLEAIVFEGTKAQWNAVEKAVDWNIDCGEITVTCTDGVIVVPAWEG